MTLTAGADQAQTELGYHICPIEINSDKKERAHRFAPVKSINKLSGEGKIGCVK